VASQNPHDSGTREDVALSSDSGRDGCPSEDSDFSCDEDHDARGFASRREFLCFEYLYGRAHVTLRQYDNMRDAENSWYPTEKWPSRWRLRKLREHMLKSAILLRREKKTHQLPVEKGKVMRTLPDVEVSYITFSEHLKRDFVDTVTAVLFHNKGDSRMDTGERPAESFQTVAARNPARFDTKNVLFREQYRFDIGCTVKVSFHDATAFEARVLSTSFAPDGCVTASASTYASERTLSVGDSIALLPSLFGFMPPECWTQCLTKECRGTLRFTRSGGVFVIAVRESTEHERDSWSVLTAASPLELSCAAEPKEGDLSEKDPYIVYVSLYGDEFNVHTRCSGSLKGYYRGYTSLCLEDGAFSVRPFFYLPPGASPEALLKNIVDDLMRVGKEGFAVYEAFKKESAVIRVYLCLVVFDFPMAAQF